MSCLGLQVEGLAPHGLNASVGDNSVKVEDSSVRERDLGIDGEKGIALALVVKGAGKALIKALDGGAGVGAGYHWPLDCVAVALGVGFHEQAGNIGTIPLGVVAEKLVSPIGEVQKAVNCD